MLELPFATCVNPARATADQGLVKSPIPRARSYTKMFDRFTDRAKKVMSFARQEAMKFNREYIGTEHILLGLVQEGSGVAANVLKNMIKAA